MPLCGAVVLDSPLLLRRASSLAGQQPTPLGDQAAWVFCVGQGGARRAEDTEQNTQAA